MENYEHGLLFDPALSAEIKERFCYVDADCSLRTPAAPCA